MADVEKPLLGRFRREIDRLTEEVRQMAALRWQLARLEIEADLRQARRLALGLSIAATLGVAAVALVCVALAVSLASWFGGSQVGWRALMASVLLAGAVLIGWTAWRTFRRRFTGLQETLEELREDAAWIGEWVGERAGERENGRAGDPEA